MPVVPLGDPLVVHETGAFRWYAGEANGGFVDWSIPPRLSSPIVTEVGYREPLKVLLVNHKTFWDQSPAIISCLALLVSLGGVVYNALAARSKDKKARSQSINDEFWMRKVLFPLSIEPALAYYTAVETTLPKDRFHEEATPEAIENFLPDFTEAQAGFRGSAVALGLMNAELYAAVSLELESIEDTINQYCYENKSGYNSDADLQGAATRAETLTSVRESVVNLLKHIKNYQEGLK